MLLESKGLVNCLAVKYDTVTPACAPTLRQLPNQESNVLNTKH